MKISKLFTAGALAFSLVLASCGGGTKHDADHDDHADSTPPNADQAKEMTYQIDTEKSVVKWRGFILGMKEHTGTLKFKNGSLKTAGDKITGGGLEVDMTSMAATDDNFDAEHPREGLIGHLSSPDFFDVAAFPMASLVFSGGTDANLSVRDKTMKEAISDVSVKEVDGKMVYTAKLTFDRQKYGVAFSGPAKDVIISDDVELEVELHTK